MHRKNKIKVILCGGGTGGHIFPMISVANELKNENKEKNEKNEVPENEEREKQQE